MNDTEAQILAKLSSIEFMIEIIVGQQWGFAPKGEAELAHKTILDLSKSAYAKSEITDEDFAKIAKHFGPEIQALLDKCLSRSESIRGQLTQGL